MAKQALVWTKINLDKSPAIAKLFAAEKKARDVTSDAVRKAVAAKRGVAAGQVVVGRNKQGDLSYAISEKATATGGGEGEAL